MNRRFLVFGAAATSAAAFAGAAWYFGRSPEPVASIPNATNDPMVRPYSPVIGPPNAAVTIVEFFDPACEACRAFHPIVKQIVAAFPGKVRVVLRYRFSSVFERSHYHSGDGETTGRIRTGSRSVA